MIATSAMLDCERMSPPAFPQGVVTQMLADVRADARRDHERLRNDLERYQANLLQAITAHTHMELERRLVVIEEARKADEKHGIGFRGWLVAGSATGGLLWQIIQFLQRAGK